MTLRLIANRRDGLIEARCPTLPGCTGRGGTLSEALDAYARQVWGYLAAATDFQPERLCVMVEDEQGGAYDSSRILLRRRSKGDN